MRRGCAVSVVVCLALAGCAGNENPSSDPGGQTSAPSESPSQPPTSPSQDSSATESMSPDDDTLEVEVEIEGDDIKPNGERVEVGVGETIRLRVKSDRAGELHVHSTPEQELSFGKGRSLIELKVDQPGIVDVEEHEAAIVILQLEVS